MRDFEKVVDRGYRKRGRSNHVRPFVLLYAQTEIALRRRVEFVRSHVNGNSHNGADNLTMHHTHTIISDIHLIPRQYSNKPKQSKTKRVFNYKEKT